MPFCTWRCSSWHSFGRNRSLAILWIREEFHVGYQGEKTVIFGHTPTYRLHHNPTDYSVYFGENNIIGIDGGAVFGGQLHALEWPSHQIISVERKSQQV